MSQSPQRWYCSCGSVHCDCWVYIPLDIALRINSEGLILITKTCHLGPSARYEFVEEFDEYTLYKAS